MPPFHDCRDGGLLVLDPAAAMFGGVRQRKRARVTAVPPCVFAAAAAEEEALRAAPAAKRQRQREAPTLDALPDGCLFEILRRVQGARARGASSCVSRRWLALLGGIRASEIKRVQAPAVPDLNQVFVCEDEDEAEAARLGRSERTLEGERRCPGEPPDARRHRQRPLRGRPWVPVAPLACPVGCAAGDGRGAR